MAKKDYYEERKPLERRKIHSIWKFIGIILVIMTPIMAYFASVLVMDLNETNRWVSYPSELLLRRSPDPLILVKVLLTIIIIILFFGVYTLVTAVIASVFGSSRYGPLDVPPVEYKGREYKR